MLAACYERANGGRGRLIDVNPVDALLHVAAPAIAEWVPGERPPMRQGGRLAGSPVRNTYRCKDGGWVAISCSTPRHLDQLLELVGHRPSTGAIDDGEIDGAVAAWAGRTGRAELIEQMAACRPPVAPVHDAATLRDDPHVVARRALRLVVMDVGVRVVAAPAPRFEADRDSSPWCSDAGADNDEVLRDLIGLDADALARLEREGVT